MNARERTAAERLEQWQFDSSAAPPDPDDIRTVVAAVRRWDRLANEELTDDDKNFIEATIESINVNNSNDRRYLSAHADYLCVGLMSIVERLQAHLAAAKDAVAVAEGIASDALEDRGLPRIEEVRREAARECVEIIKGLVIAGSEFSTVRKAAIAAIRRRFGLAAPQPAETLLMSQVSDPNSFEPAETPVLDVIRAWNSVPDPQPAEPVCQRCNGSKEVACYRPPQVTTCCGRSTRTRSDINQSRDGIYPVWCSACWATYLPEHSGYKACPDCAGTDRVAARRLED